MDWELRGDRRAGREMLLRVGLLALAVPEAVTALWALVSPKSFYRDFPGLGHHWLVSLGPFNEHLTVDFGATSLALATLVLAAAVVLEPRLVRVALGCWLVWAIPHLAYHLTTPEHSLSVTMRRTSRSSQPTSSYRWSCSSFPFQAARRAPSGSD